MFSTNRNYNFKNVEIYILKYGVLEIYPQDVFLTFGTYYSMNFKKTAK